MRKLIVAMMLMGCTSIWGQYGEQNNRFSQSPDVAAKATTLPGNEDQPQNLDNPSNPGDEDVPIDHGIPVLLLIGIVLTAYYGIRQHRQKTSNYR